MSKQKKKIAIFVLILFTLTILTKTVFAYTNAGTFSNVEYTEEFRKWLELPEEERKQTMMPKMYETTTNIVVNNILSKARMLKAGESTSYNLKNVIPENLTIKDQQETQACWAFASVSSLETNLALANLRQGVNTKVYDFSERHMEYATSQNFANNVQNESGYNRTVGDGGNWIFAESYLTNGQGAINEADMPFENNEDLIDINEIRNKVVTSQVYDTVDFPDYSSQTGADRTATMNAIKQHIQNYGSVFASIHGNSSNLTGFSCYNPETGAKYCNNDYTHGADHAISIIGWDDEYSIANFAVSNLPTDKGAWIVRNSWGSDYGDNGLIYVSYYDCNISETLFGIEKATDKVNYQTIYQYDYYYPAYSINYTKSKIILCNVFNKKSTGTEYLTQVSLYAPETYQCKVYVNPNGAAKTSNSMQRVQLKAGATETIGVGYHTLEFAEPIEITGNEFAVAVAIEGTASSGISIMTEAKIDELDIFDNVTVETGKCFMGTTDDFSTCQWYDLGTISSSFPNANISNGDSTLKAFTVPTVYDESLQRIVITNPPDKTSYYEGENFDKTGMTVTAYYNSQTNPEVVLDDSSYNIINGSNLTAGQTSVTISYEGKTAEQRITVAENTVTEINIVTPPNKTTYKEGEDFDPSGMVVNATYRNGDTNPVTGYSIENGEDLEPSQTSVTISYGGQTAEQQITVIPNPLMSIAITKMPKTTYVVGQDFDDTGMEVTGTYQDGSTNTITNYTIENGENLTLESTIVTISYKGKTADIEITVIEKAITAISIGHLPNKTEYIQNEENLELEGGVLHVEYNDDSSEDISLTSNSVIVSGFDNTVVGKNTITVEYEGMTTSFEVDIVEKPQEQPVGANFDDADCEATGARYYYYTDGDTEDYMKIDIIIDNISLSTENDSQEYFYYLSPNQNERNITDWVKMTQRISTNNKLAFTIDTRDLNNMQELLNSDKIYLYVKVVSVKGGNQLVTISEALDVGTTDNLELYKDDVRIDTLDTTNNNSNNNSNNNNNQTNNGDKTTATGTIPQTGIGNKLIILIGLTIICAVIYIRYRHLNNLTK